MKIRIIIFIGMLSISSVYFDILLGATPSPKIQKNHIIMIRGSNAESQEKTPPSISTATQTQAQKIKTLALISNEIRLEGLSDVIRKCTTIKMAKEIYSIAKVYYPKFISAVRWEADDVVFMVNGREIMYVEGRMLSRENIPLKNTFRSIIYPYNTAAITAMFDTIPEANPNLSTTYYRSSDFHIALTGGIPRNLKDSIQDVRVLGFTVRLHTSIAEVLKKASDEILTLAKTDKSLDDFLASIRTISGFRNRNVKGSANVSMHAFGFAFDLIPYSYDNKVAYWKWAKVLYPDTWNKKPLNERWLIHPKAVTIFEKYGFIWGGKWPNYDTIHIEYRPALITNGQNPYAASRKKH